MNLIEELFSPVPNIIFVAVNFLVIAVLLWFSRRLSILESKTHGLWVKVNYEMGTRNGLIRIIERIQQLESANEESAETINKRTFHQQSLERAKKPAKKAKRK